MAWDKFIDILTEESMDGCDGASDEFLLGIIRSKIQQSYSEESLTIIDLRKNFICLKCNKDLTNELKGIRI